MKSLFKFLLLVLIVSMIVAGLYNWQVGRSTKKEPRAEKYTPASASKLDARDVHVLSQIDKEYTALVNAVVPSVVSITTTRTVRMPSHYFDPLEYFFGRRGGPSVRERTQMGLGSGVIVSKEGHILTNFHVIKGMDEAQIHLSDGRSEAARVIGIDEDVDVAVLKIDASDLSPLPFGNSDDVEVGQLVFAVGSPFGLAATVTQGIISAKGRRTVSDSANEFFQIDAAINRGNSGGPLVNLKGEVIGINNQIFSTSGGWQGVGFAIPSNTARHALESVIKHGRVVRGYLGVVIQHLTADLAEQFGVKDKRGALVVEVSPGSPAEKAGLKSGDIIRMFDGKKIKDPIGLRNRVFEVEIGSKVKMEIIRDGKEKELEATIAEAPARPRISRGEPEREPVVPGLAQGALAGISVREVTPALIEHLSLPENIEGVVVAQVDPESPAAQALEAGDVIEEINRQRITSVKEFEEIAGSLDPGKRQMLFVCRGKTRSFVVLNPR